MNPHLRWCFFIPGMPFLGDTLERESLGGSESAGLYLARDLSRLGDTVFLFNNAETAGEYDGVNYLPAGSFRDFAAANPHDVCVVQRAPELLGVPMASKLNILWQHDMTLGRHRQGFAGVLWNIDRIALLSQYMADHYRAVHDLHPSLVFQTRNGICLEEFDAHRGLPRDPFKLMYTSRPERGLDVLLEHILPALLEREPRYRLHLAGYDNKMHGLQEMYARIEQLVARHRDRVVWLGHLTHAQLYEHYATAHLLLYPTPSPAHHVFDEISWITGMEAQASGLPVVASNRGAIGETLAPKAGRLIDVPSGGCASAEYVSQFVEAVEAYRVPEIWQGASRAGLDAARNRKTVAGDGLDWRAVAEQWRDEAIAQIRARNDCPRRLVAHFCRREDQVAAAQLARSQSLSMPPPRDRGRQPPEKAIASWRDQLEQHARGKVAWLGDAPSRNEAPWAVIDAAEAGNDWVAFYAPYGPWRNGRLWDFEVQDLADILTSKSEVNLQSAVAQICPDTGEPLGMHFVSYQVEGSGPARPVDMERKLLMQRPRQTLAVTIIAGGDAVEDTARWCLKSFAPIADEIVVADTGMTGEARQIFESFGARIIPAPSPLEHGFETPRNLAVDAALGDWILWIDTDERLLGGNHMVKYLRQNSYAGYSIRQHHFAVDTQFSPDMPVRLFRRAGWEGDPIRFVGMIHEHPELGVNRGPGPVLILPDVNIAHVGYLTEQVRRVRFARNNPLLERDKERYPDRILQKHFIMRDNSILINFELQKNGGRVTQEIVERAEENRRLYKEHMLGRNDYLHIDPTPYLAQALRVLNKGIDVSFSVAAGREGRDVPLNGTVATRFETQEDAVAEITHRVKQAMAPYEAEIW